MCCTVLEFLSAGSATVMHFPSLGQGIIKDKPGLIHVLNKRTAHWLISNMRMGASLVTHRLSLLWENSNCYHVQKSSAEFCISQPQRFQSFINVRLGPRSRLVLVLALLFCSALTNHIEPQTRPSAVIPCSIIVYHCANQLALLCSRPARHPGHSISMLG